MFLLASVLISASSVALSGPVAVFTPEKSECIELVTSVEDGRSEVSPVSGRSAVTLRPNTDPPSRYLYFRLSPEAKVKVGSEAYLVVDFLNRGVGRVEVQYNAEGNPYLGGAGFLVLADRKWDRALVHLTGVTFEGLQNGGADFRLACAGRPAVSRIEVYAEDPGLNLPSEKERVMKNFKQADTPKDMSYCFGANFVGEGTALLY